MIMNKSIILLFIGILFSIGNFLYGFLINRSEIYEISSCNTDVVYCKYSPYKRIVILLVDSLKYEFIDPSLVKESHYQGQVDIIRSLIKKKPKYVHVSHFISDPPTTTLQRIKGLTTGSLPTFIDISSNFGSSELLEDNIINQWHRSGFGLKFVGDDTWMDLFPNSFNVSAPYPSFNIKDLDTVDKKVEEFILNSLKNTTVGKYDKPEIILGHMLGIDHCGHTFGKNHRQMKRKLMELNEFIKKIVEFIDKDTLFVMFGDHGMTTSGDHGGDSSEEIDAGFFLMSGKQLNVNNKKSKETENYLSQIDLVPTLSAITGVAIPFSNLGVLKSELLTSNSRARFYTDLNIQQIVKYINSYENKFGNLGFPQSIKKFLDNSIKANNTEENVRNLHQIKELFQSKWAKFSLPLIYGGILSFSLYIISISNFLIVHQMNQENKKSRSCKYIFYLLLNSLHFFIKDNFLFPYIFLFFILFELCIFLKNRSVVVWPMITNLNIVIYVVGFLNLVLAFSNSFIISEDRIMQFFVQTILLVKAIQSLVAVHNESNASKPKKFERNFTQAKSNSKILIFFIFMSFIFGSLFTVLGLKYKICREEQRQWCTSESGSNDKFLLFSVFLIPLMIVIHRLWLRHCGNLTSTDCNVILIKFLLPFSGFCLFTFQAVQISLESSAFSEIAEMVLLVFPRIIVICTLIIFIFLAISPLLIFHQRPFELNDSVDVPSLFKYLRLTQSGEKLVTVYGLATIYSSPILTALLSCCILVSVFLKVQFVFGIISIVGILFSYSILTNLSINFKKDNILLSFSTPEFVIFMTILTQYGFFTTGHQTTIANIPWYSVFIGWKSDHLTKIIPFFMLNINLFSAQIVITLFGLLLPLLLLLISLGPASLFRNRTTSKHSDECVDSTVNCGDFNLFKTDTESHQFRIWVQCYYVLYMLYHSIAVYFVILSTGYSRRHLMAWKIFVPKMLYSVINLLVVYVMTGMSYLFLMRLHRLAVKWRLKNV